MAKLTKEKVEHTAFLARIKLSVEEVEKFQTQINDFLTHTEKMSDVDTSSVSETSQVTGIENVLRDDETHESLSQDDCLANAPESENHSFKMPKYHDN